MSGTAAAGTVPRAMRTNWMLGSTALPPLAWLVHIAAMPALVPLACETGQSWFLHATTIVTAAVAVVGLVGSHRTRSDVRQERERRDDGPHEPIVPPEVCTRARAWGTVGLLNGWLFTVLIVAEHLPVLVLEACPP